MLFSSFPLKVERKEKLYREIVKKSFSESVLPHPQVHFLEVSPTPEATGEELHEHFLGSSNSSTRRMENLDITQGISPAKQSVQLSWIGKWMQEKFSEKIHITWDLGKKASGIYS